MHQKKEWQSVCSKVPNDGLRAYNLIKKKLHGSEIAKPSQYSGIQGLVFGHAKEVMLLSYVVC